MRTVKILGTGLSAFLLLQVAVASAAKPKPAQGESLDTGGAFLMPIVQPTSSTPPPYRYKDAKAITIAFVTDPGIAAKWVPPPLKPDPAQQWMAIYFGHYPMEDVLITYNEAGLVIPVLRDGKPGLYVPIMYLDKVEPIIGGREVYGFPKLGADQITLDEENGKITASVTRYGKVIIKATVEAQQKLDPIPPRPPLSLYMVKLIPSAKVGTPPDVLQLVYVPEERSTKEMRLGKATLEFGDSPFDPIWTKIPVQQVVYADAVSEDFVLGSGEVVTNYLEKAKGMKPGAAKP